MFIFLFCFSAFLLVIVLMGIQISETLKSAFLKEMNKIHEHDHANPVEVTEVVQKYIPIGTSEQKAIEFLKNNDFNLYPQMNSKTIIAINQGNKYKKSFQEHFLYFGYYYDYEVVVKFNNHRVDNVKGEMRFHGM